MLQEERPLALFISTTVKRLFRQDADPSGYHHAQGTANHKRPAGTLVDRILDVGGHKATY